MSKETAKITFENENGRTITFDCSSEKGQDEMSVKINFGDVKEEHDGLYAAIAGTLMELMQGGSDVGV